MAETVLTPVIDKLLQLLINEAKLFKGVHGEITSLKDELDIIQSFLKDGDSMPDRGNMDSAVKIWMKQVRELADRIEDTIDEYLHHVAQRRHHRRGFIGFIRKAGFLLKALKPSYDIASEIRTINESLTKIKDRGERYGLRPIWEKGASLKGLNNVERHEYEYDPRLGSLFMEEDELVGIESTLEEVVKCLVEGEPIRSTISLVGEGGIGKTTLAKRVYDDEAVKEHFDCHAWITVSQSYSIGRLVRSMIRQICPTEESLVEENDPIQEIISPLRQYLQTKRYVVVFDDIWQTDFWEVIRHALPANSKCSRIIITTRNVRIANYCKETAYDTVKELQTWSPELAWELFCKKAFRSNFERRCPQELETLSHEIVSKCQGLPLVIAAIAGLLSTKEKVESEWQKVLDNISSEFKMNPQLTSISKVLCLGFDDLPYHLKLCFLYFGIIPEDYSIHENTLYRLWIAEGFVKEKGDKTLEQVAEEYLSELIHRNLVSFELLYRVDRWCRIHHLMREIVLSKADELCYCQVFYEKKLRPRGNYRRLTICNSMENVLETIQDSGVRSIFLFNINGLTKSFVISLFERYKLLKVLDFENAPLDDLPKEVGNLFHLKYLCLKDTNLKVLPKSIGKLHNLQTLDLGHTSVCELPIEINKLQNLRHLFANSYKFKLEYGLNTLGGVRISDGVGQLEDLQTLILVEAYPGGSGLVKELEKLRQLRWLGISKLTADIGKALCTAIEKMNHLEKLYLASISEDEILDLQHISFPPPCLRYLFLKGRLEKLPDWILSPNLCVLDLSFSRLTSEPLNCLKSLPKLECLNLYQAYDGEELHFEEGSFQKLKELRLRKLEGLKVVKIDDGALNLLDKLVIGPSQLMREVPSDIQHLKNLKHLEVVDVPKEFVSGMQPEIGADYWKVKHVPFVSFWYRQEGNIYDVYKLGESDLLERLQEQE
ncbi:NB-ARC domain, LRR domain containing protein [Trema orientale]|uniref:NB-ARC domain, LRR domain containing protein n=1 Tax=Trema orientale TaxID=63057 RepID=A0A2P5CXQ9_TREOI|nr:NB-ARC domain, LRR domain containing protein [Trema orientale]